MGAVERLLEKARSQVGYLEKSKAAYDADPGVLDDFKRGAGMDNYTKYARDQWKVKYFNSSKQGVAWCAVFVGWCFLECFGKDAALRLQCQPRSGNAGAGCGSAANYYKAKKRFVSEPEAGDQIFFVNGSGEVSHTGIVEKVAGGRVYTIEGNSDGAVQKHHYKVDSERIYGYGRPDWSIVKEDGKEDGKDRTDGKDGRENNEEDRGSMDKSAIVVRTATSKGSTVNLRSQPNASARVLAKVPFDSTVTVKEDGGEWCRVEYAGTTGWMMANYIEYAGMSDDDADAEPARRHMSEEDWENIESLLARIETVGKEIDGVLDLLGEIVGRG